MSIDVTAIFQDHLASNQGLVPGNPGARQTTKYGIHASFNNDCIELQITFLREMPYCCFELGCHLGLHESKRWDWLRQGLQAMKLNAPSRMKLQVKVHVENGALFFDYSQPDPSHHGWYAFAPVGNLVYETTLLESEG